MTKADDILEVIKHLERKAELQRRYLEDTRAALAEAKAQLHKLMRKESRERKTG